MAMKRCATAWGTGRERLGVGGVVETVCVEENEAWRENWVREREKGGCGETTFRRVRVMCAE